MTEKARKTAEGRIGDGGGDAPDVSILDRLREVRKIHGWSQTVMAARLSLTPAAYRSIETGRTVRLEWEIISRLNDILVNTKASVPSGYSVSIPAPGPLSLSWLLGHGKGRPLPELVKVAPEEKQKRGYRRRV